MTDAPAHATHVATLICDPALPALGTALLDRARAILPGSGAPRWLETGVAADLPFVPTEGGAEPRAVAEGLRATLAGLPIDWWCSKPRTAARCCSSPTWIRP